MQDIHLDKTHQLDDLYATCGDQVYLIGSQHGGFPPIGGHVPGEMGGVWDHPIKLLDGFWFAITEDDQVWWLTDAVRYRIGLGYSQLLFQRPDLEVERWEFAPDGLEGLCVELLLKDLSGRKRQLTATFLVRTDLQPAWLGERAGLFDHADQAMYSPELKAICAWDSGHPWQVMCGSDQEPAEAAIGDLPTPEPAPGQGISGRLSYHVTLQPNGKAILKFAIAGSTHSQQRAIVTYRRILQQSRRLFRAKQRHYQRLADTCVLHSPDPLLDRAFLWAKLDFQMLARTVDGLGQGAGAGLPEYPWWFGCDSEYAVPPMVAAGQFELAKSTLRLLATTSQQVNGNGRMVHELATNGQVYNEGNAVEAALFTRAVYHTYRWSGDQQFLREMYPLCRQALLDYLLKECDPDKDLYPGGRSIVESPETAEFLEALDTACYTWEGLQLLAELAPDAGDGVHAARYRTLAERLGRGVRRQWW
ncbi:MAG: hypothetical protein HY335_00180, partial [Deinococcus sp.]|nr:hypothetical protein [Deinococcus sp.]